MTKNAEYTNEYLDIMASLDGDVSFRVYDGEKFTEATIKVYGFYNELAARVEIGYLI